MRTALHSCDFDIENSFTFESVRLVNHHLCWLIADDIGELPRICNNVKFQPKPQNGKHIVELYQAWSVFCNSITVELKWILDFSYWNSGWMLLLPGLHSCFNILN